MSLLPRVRCVSFHLSCQVIFVLCAVPRVRDVRLVLVLFLVVRVFFSRVQRCLLRLLLLSLSLLSPLPSLSPSLSLY